MTNKKLTVSQCLLDESSDGKTNVLLECPHCGCKQQYTDVWGTCTNCLKPWKHTDDWNWLNGKNKEKKDG